MERIRSPPCHEALSGSFGTRGRTCADLACPGSRCRRRPYPDGTRSGFRTCRSPAMLELPASFQITRIRRDESIDEAVRLLTMWEGGPGDSAHILDDNQIPASVCLDAFIIRAAARTRVMAIPHRLSKAIQNSPS